MTVSSPKFNDDDSSPSVVRQGSVAPTAGVGNSGDWFVFDAGDAAARSQPPVLYRPKSAGAWGTTYKHPLPAAAPYMADSKGILTTGHGPLALSLSCIENVSGTPVANPFTNVSGPWTSGGGQFYSSNRAQNAFAVCSSILAATFDQPQPFTQYGHVKINVLPSATDGATAGVGVGSIHPAALGFGYGVWADKDGRFCIGRMYSGLEGSGGGGGGVALATTGTGVVTAGRYLAFRRTGGFCEGFVLDSNGVLVSGTTLACITDAGYDGAFGAGIGVYAVRSQDARMSNFFGVS
jgi:hypothetical protein